MTSIHQPQTGQAGDDWEIAGTLLDSEGKPANLVSATIEWGLNVDRQIVIAPDDVTVTVTVMGTGTCTIFIPRAVTNVPPGRYMDVLRLMAQGTRATMWMGPITVNASLLDTGS